MKLVGTESSYPLSPMQQGILFHSLYEQHSGLYIQQLVCAIHQELDVNAFVRAWEELVSRHETLRTSFSWDGTHGAQQEVQHGVVLPFEQEDWRRREPNEQEERLASYLRADRERAFKFDEAPLMRFALFRFAEDEFRFVWTSHHALFDGRSRLLLLRELAEIYGGELKTADSRDYREYVEWLERQDLSRAESFWREELRGFESPNPLRVSSGSDQSCGGHSERELRLNADETDRIQDFTDKNGLTVNTLLQAAWALLLSRYSGDQDVIFGTTRSGRRSIPGGAESMIGLVINTLPVRVRVTGSAVVLDWLKTLRTQQIALREYEHTPLIKIQEWSEVPKGLPLFESLVVFEKYQLGEVLRNESPFWRNTDFQLLEQANYPLSILGYGGRELLLKVGFDRQRFDEQTIAQLLRHLRLVLLSFANSPAQKLREIDLLTAQEREQLIVERNRTTVEYSPPQCVHELFAEQVERTPHAVALKSEDEELTYRELDRRANRLARRLRSLGVGPNNLCRFVLSVRWRWWWRCSA